MPAPSYTLCQISIVDMAWNSAVLSLLEYFHTYFVQRQTNNRIRFSLYMHWHLGFYGYRRLRLEGSTNLIVCGNCEGLFFLITTIRDEILFYVWIPYLSRSIRVSIENLGATLVGFWCNHSDFKILCVSRGNNKQLCANLYTSKRNSWDSLQDLYLSVARASPKAMGHSNGKLHFIALRDKNPVMIAFEVANGEFTEIQ